MHQQQNTANPASELGDQDLAAAPSDAANDPFECACPVCDTSLCNCPMCSDTGDSNDPFDLPLEVLRDCYPEEYAALLQYRVEEWADHRRLLFEEPTYAAQCLLSEIEDWIDNQRKCFEAEAAVESQPPTPSAAEAAAPGKATTDNADLVNVALLIVTLTAALVELLAHH